MKQQTCDHSLPLKQTILSNLPFYIIYNSKLHSYITGKWWTDHLWGGGYSHMFLSASFVHLPWKEHFLMINFSLKLPDFVDRVNVASYQKHEQKWPSSRVTLVLAHIDHDSISLLRMCTFPWCIPVWPFLLIMWTLPTVEGDFPSWSLHDFLTAHAVILEWGRDVESPAVGCRTRQTQQSRLWTASCRTESLMSIRRFSNCTARLRVCTHESVSTKVAFLRPHGDRPPHRDPICPRLCGSVFLFPGSSTVKLAPSVNGSACQLVSP